jgi:carbamate kinase
VDAADPAFDNPTKPVGPHYTETELAFRVERLVDDAVAAEPDAAANEVEVEGEVYRRVEGGTWRRVVPSPMPIDVVEAEAVRRLLEVGVIPVCAGGGGCPVARTPGGLQGVEAVVDKDLTAALLVRLLAADALLILTDVDSVLLDYGTDAQRPLRRASSEQARRLLADGQFPAGSMGPKVSAAASVAEQGGVAIITSLDRAEAALRGEAGTRISD